MSKTLKIETKGENPVKALQNFLKSILELDSVSAILVPQRLPMKNVVMPSLISNPEYLDAADPLAPSFPINAAKLVSKLTRKPSPGKVVAVMRPCESRAFTELVKLNQGHYENLVILGIDCLGAYDNKEYLALAEKEGETSTEAFLKGIISEEGAPKDDELLATACLMCEKPVPDKVDLSIGLFGVDTREQLLLQAISSEGEKLVEGLTLSEAPEPMKRAEVIQSLTEKRTAYRDQIFEKTSEAISSTANLTHYLADCVNCYNCRVACPVCYCRECVMLTDVFDHAPHQFLQWSNQRGFLKMPTDTVFYHTTRLVHMSLSCVGCGQCSNACPNDIPLVELFRTVAHDTQQTFEYEAGRDPEERLPLSMFEEEEFEEIVGIKQKGA